jgi:hypothetical protein
MWAPWSSVVWWIRRLCWVSDHSLWLALMQHKSSSVPLWAVLPVQGLASSYGAQVKLCASLSCVTSAGTGWLLCSTSQALYPSELCYQCRDWLALMQHKSSTVPLWAVLPVQGLADSYAAQVKHCASLSCVTSAGSGWLLWSTSQALCPSELCCQCREWQDSAAVMLAWLEHQKSWLQFLWVSSVPPWLHSPKSFPLHRSSFDVGTCVIQ